MISHYQSMTNTEKVKTIFWAAFGAAVIYGLFWAFALGCVAIHGLEVCGV